LKQQGHCSCERRVCNQHKVWSTTTRKAAKNTQDARAVVHDDLMQRVCSAPAPGRLLLDLAAGVPMAQQVRGIEALDIDDVGRVVDLLLAGRTPTTV
jgi:hypothetical protein